jgi:DNA processing protein
MTVEGRRRDADVAAIQACDACLRRTDLIVAVSGSIDIAWRERQGRTSRVLARPDEELLALDASAAPRYAAFSPAFARRRIAAAGLSAVCRCGPAYPDRLRELPDPPAVLHIAGSPDALPRGEAVARRATPYGLEVSTALGRVLTTAGVPIVSGMALGIDSAAHLGALEGLRALEGLPAGPSPPVAVLAPRPRIPPACATSTAA